MLAYISISAVWFGNIVVVSFSIWTPPPGGIGDAGSAQLGLSVLRSYNFRFRQILPNLTS